MRVMRRAPLISLLGLASACASNTAGLGSDSGPRIDASTHDAGASDGVPPSDATPALDAISGHDAMTALDALAVDALATDSNGFDAAPFVDASANDAGPSGDGGPGTVCGNDGMVCNRSSRRRFGSRKQ
jgi:hypothetical protein